MNTSAERQYRLSITDFDRYGKLHPTCVLDVFQDIAVIQATEMGIGPAEMSAKGCFWAVTRMKYEVVRSPKPHQMVVAKTWPHTPTRFSFLRDYSMSSLEGELLVKATSEWVVMDAEKRSFVSVMDVYDDAFELESERMFERKPRKLKGFDEAGLEPYEVVPGFSDVDINGHINNSRYANYIMDALNPGAGLDIRSLQIDFRQEVLSGELLRVYTLQDEGEILSKGVDSSGGCMFVCKMEL